MGKARKHGRRLMIRGAVGKAISQFATTPLPLWLDSLRSLSLLPSLMGEDYACCPAGGSNREALPAAAASLGIGVFEHEPSRKVIRSGEHRSELQSLMRITNAGFSLKKKKK